MKNFTSITFPKPDEMILELMFSREIFARKEPNLVSIDTLSQMLYGPYREQYDIFSNVSIYDYIDASLARLQSRGYIRYSEEVGYYEIYLTLAGRALIKEEMS